MVLGTNKILHEIDAQTLKEWLSKETAILVDVREAGEYAAERIPGAILHPASTFNPDSLTLTADKKLVLYCQSGQRSARVGGKCIQAGLPFVAQLKGGLPSWKAAGFALEKSKNAPISIFRQVQIVAETLVFLGTVLGAFISTKFLLLSGFVGAGLVFAGLSNTCAMGVLLSKLPYNQTQA